MLKNNLFYETYQIMFTKVTVAWRNFSKYCHCQRNRAGPKDRGRPLTFTFSQNKSYPKRLTSMIFAEVGVRFSSGSHYIMILAFQAV